MFSAIRRRMHITPSTMIATLALVFAMSGGAYAASKYIITSTKQISPKVLKSLKGAKGATGAAGAAGAAGAQGAQGLKGETGAAGSAGVKGEKGEKGDQGIQGTQGEKGEEGTFGKEPLQKGAKETGAWGAASGSAAGVVVTAVSFPTPLAAPLADTQVHYVTYAEWHGGTAPLECPGSAENPEALEGNLCVYTSQFGELNVTGSPEVFVPGEGSAQLGGKKGAGTQGFAVLALTSGAGFASGTWAVTAK